MFDPAQAIHVCTRQSPCACSTYPVLHGPHVIALILLFLNHHGFYVFFSQRCGYRYLECHSWSERSWKMDGFILVSVDSEDSVGDLPVSVTVFTFTSRNTSPLGDASIDQEETFVVNALSSILRASGHIILIIGSSALCATAYKCGRKIRYVSALSWS
ncbi:hypothetical protein BDR07DRAFT_783391 [Suillus spraguei]|nr:hypothetical protein BDR07DRAFT_783391 [Suillus spraguei]